ncbi:MAG: hypothetical protein IKO72_03315 [Kiritimatiellae bacterium]|nr:hypothetical protein [Kiritimatiellia bacterium]
MRKSMSIAIACMIAGTLFADVKPTPAAGFCPRVGKDASFSFGVNLDRRQFFKIVDAYTDLAFKTLKLDEEEIAEARKKIAAYKKDPFHDDSPEVKKFVNESGLGDATLRWAMLSVDGVKNVDDDFKPEGISLAVAGTINLEKLLPAIQKKSCEKPGEGVHFKEITIGGEKAWSIEVADREQAETMKAMNIEPCVTSLDGQLVLLAQTRATLETLIRLYRKGEGGVDMTGRFSAAEGELAYLQFSGIGEIIRQNVSTNDLKAVTQIIPDGDKVILGLKRLDITIKLLPDATFSDSIRLDLASEEDADKLRTLAKTGLMLLNAQTASDPDTPPEMKKIVESIRIGGTDGRIDVHGGGLLLLATGAVLPAATAASRSANTAATAMHGRNLFVSIVQTNTEREAAGLASVWPRTMIAASTDKEDIAGMTFKSATEYFNHLFDMKNYGTDKWEPYVSCDISVLGENALEGKTLQAEEIGWCVAANVTAEMPDNIPVLISANFNPKYLLRKWDHSASAGTLPIGPKSGAAKSMFEDKAIVVVYKGGASQVIKQKDLTYNALYRGRPFDLTKLEAPLFYLTPNGVAEPSGGKIIPAERTGDIRRRSESD